MEVGNDSSNRDNDYWQWRVGPECCLPRHPAPPATSVQVLKLEHHFAAVHRHSTVMQYQEYHKDAGNLLGCRKEIEHLRRSVPAKRQLDYTGSFPKWKKIKHQMVEHQPGLVPLRKEIRGEP